MDKKKSVSGSSSSSSSSSFDHLFGPRRVPSSSSSSTTGLFQSIFPPPSVGMQADMANRNRANNYQPPNLGIPNERGERRKHKERKIYQNEDTHPPCNLSSSIFYGGQENYSSATPPQSTTTIDAYKKDGEEGDSESASRGNWWEGSLIKWTSKKVSSY
ncbi:unnamed protein product [Thlaspi arvense]|uniref:Uncharacterized protein n=1 Tax=Thlaspi arvense TaxID=13288 RepID=A0AAU9SAC9_THLAR|nr:unnamed protein product [Thlaspi arvense]